MFCAFEELNRQLKPDINIEKLLTLLPLPLYQIALCCYQKRHTLVPTSDKIILYEFMRSFLLLFPIRQHTAHILGHELVCLSSESAFPGEKSVITVINGVEAEKSSPDQVLVAHNNSVVLYHFTWLTEDEFSSEVDVMSVTDQDYDDISDHESPEIFNSILT